MWAIGKVFVLAVLVRGCVFAYDDPQTTKNQSADIDAEHSVIDNNMALPPALSKPVVNTEAPTGAVPAATTAAPADFHVGDGADFLLVQDGRICLRMDLRASFEVTFASDATQPKKSVTHTVDLPKKSFHGRGNCDFDRAKLVIVWGETNYTLTFEVRRFTDLFNSTNGHIINTTKWAVTRIEFKFDTRDASKFMTPLKPPVRVVTSEQQHTYFATPANFSYSCRSRQEIALAEHGVNASAIDSVTMSVWGVRIQALVVGPQVEPGSSLDKDVVHCSADLMNELGQMSTAPLIAAACLAVVVIIIVVVYSCIKRTNKMYYSAVD